MGFMCVELVWVCLLIFVLFVVIGYEIYIFFWFLILLGLGEMLIWLNLLGMWMLMGEVVYDKSLVIDEFVCVRLVFVCMLGV